MQRNGTDRRVERVERGTEVEEPPIEGQYNAPEQQASGLPPSGQESENPNYEEVDQQQWASGLPPSGRSNQSQRNQNNHQLRTQINTPPDPNSNCLTELRGNRLRTKTKCRFGPGSKKIRGKPNAGRENNDPQDSAEIDELFREIDLNRSEELPYPPLQLSPANCDRATSSLGEIHKRRITCRSKKKCRFGPYKRDVARHAAGHHDLNPTRRPHHNNSHFQFEGTLSEFQARANLPVHSRPNPLGPLIQTPPSLEPIGPSRVTLMPRRSHQVSPFDHYRNVPPAPPIANPNRFALQRIGISEEELEARVRAEVDDLLTQMCAERRLENLTAGSSEFPRIMTKEDCRNWFNATGIPPPGALWGVYRWAFDSESEEE